MRENSLRFYCFLNRYSSLLVHSLLAAFRGPGRSHGVAWRPPDPRQRWQSRAAQVAAAQPRMMFLKSPFSKNPDLREEQNSLMFTESVVMMGHFIVPFQLPRAEMSPCCFQVPMSLSLWHWSCSQGTTVKSSNLTCSLPEQSTFVQTVAAALENSSSEPHAS